MRSRLSVVLGCLAGSLSFAGAAASCGARTGLPLFEEVDAGFDAPHFEDNFVPPDVPEEEDVRDAPDEDMVVPDVVINECPDAASTLIYLVTIEGQFLSFYPPTLTFTTIGTLACPGEGGGNPFSMAVNRHGIAYVVYEDGELFRVSTANAACNKTSFAVQPEPFRTFGMGFVAGLTPPDAGPGTDAGDAGDAGEAGTLDIDRLFVTSSEEDAPSNLGFVSTSTYGLSVIGPIGPMPVFMPELTGTGDGRLFTYYGNESMSAYGVAQIDPNTAAILQNWPIDVPQGSAWAFAFWGGVFYIFTSTDGTSSQVHLFNPSDVSVTLVTTTPSGVVIDGAGVSTCAPTQ
jgi:hypothetical protein